MDIQKKESGRTGKLVVIEDNEELADIGYLINDEGNYVIDHTSVDQKLSGQGVGQQLVDAMVDLARETNRKIIPACEFAKKIFKRNESRYSDVWDKRE
jgi:uncharacterized protein